MQGRYKKHRKLLRKIRKLKAYLTAQPRPMGTIHVVSEVLRLQGKKIANLGQILG